MCMRTPLTTRNLIVCAAVAILLMTGVGCGKKAWPEPAVIREHFVWSSVQGEIKNSCLSIIGELSGKWTNLQAVALEVGEAEGEGACLGCPFRSAQRIELASGDPGFLRMGPRLRISYCPDTPFETGMRYRWRLIGKNAYPMMEAAVSSVQVSTP